MRALFIILTTISSLCSLASSDFVYVTVYNNCSVSIYLSTGGPSASRTVVIQAGNEYIETVHSSTLGGIDMKIATTPASVLYGDPQLFLSYTIVGGNYHYSLHDAYGDPFKGRPVTLIPVYRSGPCQIIQWPHGLPPGGPTPVRACGIQTSQRLTLCGTS